MSEIKLGADIACVCPKCKKDGNPDETNHVIIAIVDGEVKKVKCNTCGYEHSFTARKSSSSSSSSSSTTRRRTTKEKDLSQVEATTSAPLSERESEYYTRAIGNRDVSEARQYAFSDKYKEGDIIRHATFGVGVVTAVKADNKITVMFPDRLRLLVHNRSAI